MPLLLLLFCYFKIPAANASGLQSSPWEPQHGLARATGLDPLLACGGDSLGRTAASRLHEILSQTAILLLLIVYFFIIIIIFFFFFFFFVETEIKIAVQFLNTKK